MRLLPCMIVGSLLFAMLVGCTDTPQVSQDGSPTAGPPATVARLAGDPSSTPRPPSPVSISQTPSASACPVTSPNVKEELPGVVTIAYENESLRTGMWPDNIVYAEPSFVRPDGTIRMKWWWSRKVSGRLVIEGRRLDAPAPPLTANIPEGYGDTGFQSSSLFFPTDGCWEVTGRVGAASLTFVTLVLKVDKAPLPPIATPR